ncbi:MAG: S-layer homology domain-containing protein [Oscillospiraceae bacterium]|nr:S-layer homology domain-containing protein [Oscillospiraceae bacterium]
MFKTKTNHGKRALSMLMAIAMTLTIFIVAQPQKAEAFTYSDPVYLEFYFDSRSWSSVSNARVALDCLDPTNTYHPPYNSLHTEPRAPRTELFRLNDPNKPLLGGLQQMYNADDIITTYTSYSDKLIIPTYMNYVDFIAALDYRYGVLDWSKVDYQKVIMPNAYTYTIAGGGNARNDKVTFTQDRESPFTYPGDPHQIVWVTAVSQKQDALSMTVKSKPSLQLDYEGASYAMGVSGHNSWDISAVITNTASYPVYIRTDVKYYLQGSGGTETPVATDGYYYDPDNSSNQIISGSLYGYGPGDILMIPPGGQYEYAPTPFVNPPMNDKTIRAEVTVENLTSVQPEFVKGSATTLFPKATGIKNGLKLTGVYPTEVCDDGNPFTATLFGINFDKIDLGTFTAYDSVTETSTAAVDITDPAPAMEAEFINHTNERLDIVFPNGLAEGNYVFSFKDKETSPNDYYFRIEASQSHETPVWPVYGVLSIHQQSSRLFEVFGSGSEEELRILPAEPLLTFRGMVRQNSDTEYYIADGATINGTVQFRCKDFDDTKNFLKLTTANLSGDSWGNVTIESLSDDAVLLFDGTVVAQGLFEIELDSLNKYSISRTPAVGETKVALSNGTFFEFDSYGVEIHAGGLIIYKDTVGISGKVGLSDVIPGFIKQYFINVLFDLEELQLSKYAPPSLKANGEFHVGTIFDIIEASANMEFSINTLPEVEGSSDQHIYVKGDVTIFDYIQLMGELRLEAARGIYLPERFEFWARGGSLGVPLIPALTLATINGFGGGFQGLASTIDNRFNYIPNLALIFSGSIADITDQLISLSKSSITVGLRGVEGRADSVDILKMSILKNAYYSVLLTDQLYSINIGTLTFSVPGVEVTLKGGFELPFESLKASGSVMVGVYPSISINDLVNKISNFDGSAFWDILDMFEFKGTAKGEAKIPNFMPAPFGGVTIANASAEMTKYGATLRASFPALGIGEIGFYLNFPYRNQGIGFGFLSFDPSADDGAIKATGIDENGDEYTMTMMNVRRPTQVYNRRSIMPLSYITPWEASAGSTIIPLFNVTSSTANSMTVNVDSTDPYLVFSLETDTPGSISYTVIGPGGYSSTVTTNTSNSEWYEAENFDGDVVYRSLYGINSPASGEWTMTVNNPASGVLIDSYVIDPLPTIDTVTYTSGTVNWALDNLDPAKEYTVDLFVVEDDGDAANNIGQYLATVDFDGSSPVSTGTVAMPIDLPSGNYFIRAMLCEKDGAELIPQCSARSSTSFTHNNTNAPGIVRNLAAVNNGNGTVKVSWDALPAADGYILTVLQDGEPVTDSDGNVGQPIVLRDTYDEITNTPIPAPTSYVLQGGTIVADDESITGVDHPITKGYKFGPGMNYTVSVSAFNEVAIGSGAEVPVLNEDGDLTGDSADLTARVSGPAATAALSFIEPQPPEFNITFTGIDKTAQDTPELPIYLGQAPKATILIPTGCTYETTCNGDSSYTGTPVAGGFLCDLNSEDDGTYTFVVTVTNTSTNDSAEKRFVLIKDTTPPVLQIDGSGAILSSDGTISFSGNTDPDAELTLNDSDEGFEREGGLFSFSGAVTGSSIKLIASDEAGNEAELTRQLISQSTDVVSISVSADVGGVDVGSQIPLTLSPKFIFRALMLSGSEVDIEPDDQNLTWDVTIAPATAATVDSDGTIRPHEPGLITLIAVYTDAYGREFQAGGVYEIVDTLPIADLAYTAWGDNGADLSFTPPLGATNVKLQYSSDDTNWSDYSTATLDATTGTGQIRGLMYDQIYYFRLLVTGGLNEGASNSIEIVRLTPSTSLPPDNAIIGGAAEETTLTTDMGGGYTVVTPEGYDPEQGENGELSLPGGGTIYTPDGSKIIVPSGTVIDKDLKVSFPEGSGGAMIIDSYGNTFNVPEGAVIVLDKDTPLGYYINVDNQFADVKDSAWYYDAIMFAYSHGLMNGVAPELFSPNAPTTRGMVVTVLYRMAGSPVAGDAVPKVPQAVGDDRSYIGFTDVYTDAYYYDAVLWAASVGLVNGYGDGRFGPNDPVTRQDLAVILARYADYSGLSLLREDPAPDASPADVDDLPNIAFSDSSDITNYAVGAIEQFAGAGIIGGYPDGSFKPKGEATRAEFATMLMRFINSF